MLIQHHMTIFVQDGVLRMSIVVHVLIAMGIVLVLCLLFGKVISLVNLLLDLVAIAEDIADFCLWMVLRLVLLFVLTRATHC